MKRAVFILVLAVIVAAIAFGIFRVNRNSRPATIAFPDGSRFTLLAVTRNNEKFTNQKPWHKHARRWLPRKWQGWLPEEFTFSSGSGNTNAVTIWFTLLDSTGADAISLPWSWYSAVDSSGFRFPISGGNGASSSGKFTVHMVTLEAFPRRQSEFDVEFRDSGWELLGSIRVLNPVRGPFPKWTPEKMPIAKTNGPISVTLESVIERSNRFSPFSLSLSPKWKLESTDPSWQAAKPSYFQFEDPTGNRGGHLGFSERAWKLTLPFRRPNATDYSAEEKFVIPNLAIPEPGTVQVLQKNFDRLGVRFSVHALAAAGNLFITNGTDFGMATRSGAIADGHGTSSDGKTRIENWSSSKPFFLIESSPPDPLDELRFRVIASDGKELPVSSSGWYGGPGGSRRYQEKFDATNGVSSISLEVIVSRARQFEFIIDPAEVRRLNASNK